MRKRKHILSLALSAALILTLVSSAFAAKTVTLSREESGGVWYEVTISNVTSEGTKSAESTRQHILEEFTNFHLDWLDFDDPVPVYYCDSPATVAFDGGLMVVYWSGNPGEFLNNTYLQDNDGLEEVRGNIVFTAKGDYVVITVSAAEDVRIFYVSIGGSAPSPSDPADTSTPSTPSTPTTPTVPAPSTPAPGSTAALKTTDGLVSVIPPAPEKGKDLAYTIQKGENLWGIAFNYYGTMSSAAVNKIKAANKEYFADLAARNKKNKTNVSLEAGAVLILPAKGLINPVTQDSLEQAAGVYLVKKGDSLSAIAKLFYGDAKQWKKIYEANKSRVKLVGGSPMIYEKQWLVIPE